MPTAIAPPQPDGRVPVVVRALRYALIAALAVGTVYMVIATWHWPQLEDSPILHYVIFLMRHGFEPYQTITDNNLPGAYLSESTAMAIFGGGDIGWRLYDFALLGLLAGAAVLITRGKDWVASLFGGLAFLLLHAADGPNYAAERDELIAMLLVVSC